MRVLSFGATGPQRVLVRVAGRSVSTAMNGCTEDPTIVTARALLAAM